MTVVWGLAWGSQLAPEMRCGGAFRGVAKRDAAGRICAPALRGWGRDNSCLLVGWWACWQKQPPTDSS